MKNYKQETYFLCNGNKKIFSNLEKYVDLILENNKKMNLTGFDEETIWKEGIFNSIISFKTYFPYFNKQAKIVDVGPGAGFPSVPLIIFFENNFILDLVEPNSKRADFLNLVKTELKLEFNIINDRIENLDLKNKYDVVTARAVSSLRILIEITMNLGKENSLYIFPKGPLINEEILEANMIIEKLNINYIIQNIKEIEDKDLNIFSYFKNFNNIKGYPRTWAEIKKNNKIN
ncbi:MAG: 16S rRNA (guanine(527)-N(7))-methyltransferase RsmG [Metamycoplasmataceae bacterium]